MSSTVGPNLAIEHSWAERESGWKSGMDSNLKKLDAVVQLQVLDKDLTAPPGSPTSGDRYIVGASATGAWSGKDGQIAVYISAAWEFYVPKSGWAVWVADEARVYVYHSGAWTEYRPGDASGAARQLFFPAALFGSATVASADPFSDDGFYDYIDFLAAGDKKIATYFVCPLDYGATTNWKMLWAPNGSSVTTLTVYMGLNELNPGTGEQLDDPSTLGVGSFTPPGNPSRITESAFSTPSITLTPGKLYKLYFHRKNLEDANPDDMRFVGLKWYYTRS